MGNLKRFLGSLVHYVIDTPNDILDFRKHGGSLVFVNLKG